LARAEFGESPTIASSHSALSQRPGAPAMPGAEAWAPAAAEAEAAAARLAVPSAVRTSPAPVLATDVPSEAWMRHARPMQGAGGGPDALAARPPGALAPRPETRGSRAGPGTDTQVLRAAPSATPPEFRAALPRWFSVDAARGQEPRRSSAATAAQGDDPIPAE